MWSSTNVRLFTSAFLALVFGGGIYLLERPAGTAALLPSFQLVSSSWLGQHLPGFCHVFSFSILTSYALQPWQAAPLLGCLFWVGINSLFEAGQIDVIASGIASAWPDWLQEWPVLAHVDAYFLAGTFDPVDILFVVLGGLAAYCLMQRTSRAGIAASC